MMILTIAATFWILWVGDPSGRYKAPYHTYPTKELCEQQVERVVKELSSPKLGEFKVWCAPPRMKKGKSRGLK